MELPADEQASVLEQIRIFNGFTQDNNPYGERDFGTIRQSCGGKVFWKIDYYADESCSAGSEDPADPDQSYRILTIMLAEEY